MNRLLKIANAFSGAHDSYDQNALIQTFVAKKLAERVLKDKNLGSVLEIGCGTGLLSQHLVPHSENYFLSDISLPLLQKSLEKVSSANVYAVVVDGEHPCFTASFDTIVSSLALHWFQDQKIALKRLAACLKPGGKLFLSTLGNNSFHEWRTAHHIENEPCGLLDFPSFGQLKDWLPLSGMRTVEEEWITISHTDAFDFLRGIKKTGDTVSHPAYQPLPFATFKRIMESYNKRPETSCQVLFGVYQKPETLREE